MMADASALIAWFQENRRDLPWRDEPRDPYRVVVSELMLQQTQVDRVVPRFEELVRRFPGWRHLAAASEDEVLAAWSGLGYYRRARLLHRLAREVMEAGGELPSTAAELEALPGIGPYTAAAVASLVHGERVPVLDGNVIRVASRQLGFGGDPRTAAGRRTLGGWVDGLLDGGSAGVVNEALMELGATLCGPGSPDCVQCPIADGCRARQHGNPEAIPPRRRRRSTVELSWVAACCIDDSGRWLLRRVTEGPILQGLWLPPLADLLDDQRAADRAREMMPLSLAARPRVLPPVRHSITHRKIRVIPVRLAVAATDGVVVDGRWVDPMNHRLPTSSLLEKLLSANDL
jgi:A/G-specific adenine glycosylase